MIIDSPIISGSYSASGSLNQFGNVVISGSLTVTGSIIGTASFAATASYLSGYVSPFPYTGSAIISGSLEVTGSANLPNITGSLSGSLQGTASYAVTASNAVTASYLSGYVSPFPFTGSAIISGSLTVTGSVAVSNLSGSGVRYLVADESGSITAQSASAALKSTQAFTSTAGQTTFSVTNGYSTGYVDVFINGSKLSTAEFTDTSGTNIVLATGSFDGDTVEVVKYTPAAGVTNNVLRQLTTFTASAGQTVFSASYTPGLLDIFYNGSRLSTSDYTANNGTYFTLATGSADNDILDVLVYSYQVGAFNGIGGQGVANQVAFFNTTSSITGSNSFTVSGNTLVGTASYASNADTLDGAHLSILATTGSNTFTSAQYVSNTSTPIGFTDTASVYTDGGIRATKNSYFSSSLYVGGDLIIFGSQSVNYITSSQLNIADNIITVNTSTPAVRFGGIAVQDSGSLATGLTGSLLWDSQNNHWIYTNPSGSSYSGGMLISGPRNTGSMGDEQGTTLNAIMKGMGGDHITSSGMFESGSNVGIGTSSPSSKLDVSGSIRAISQGDPTSGVGAELFYRAADTSSYLQSYDRTNSLWKDVRIYGNTLYFGTQGNNSLIINVSGSVGIGTSNPNHKLSVTSDTNTSATNIARFAAANNTLAIGIGYETIRQTETGGVIKFETNATERMRINDSGLIGIGTTSFTGWASTMVLRIQGISGSTTSVLQALSYDSGSGVWMYSGASSADHPSMIYLKDLRFGSVNDLGTGAYNERMRITSTGNVGIGTASPSRALEVVASADSTPAIRVSRYGNSAQYFDIMAGGADVTFTSKATAESQFSFISDNSGTQTTRLFISQAGHVIKPYQPYFKYGVSYTGTITSATRFGTNYGFTVKTDRDAVDSSYFNKATGLFTAPIAGVYIFGCTIMRNATNGTGPVDLWICKNPSSLTSRNNSYGRGYADSYSTAYQQITIVVPIKLAVNDTVALGMQGNMTVYDDDSWFYGYLLG